MNRLSRRAFAKCLLSSAFVPVAHLQIPVFPQDTTSSTSSPDSLASRTLTVEERELAEKFLATHEKNMIPLRQHDLPNSLAPGILFASPMMSKTFGGRR